MPTVSTSSLVQCCLCLLVLLATFNVDATDDQWPQLMDDVETDSSYAPFSLAKPLSVEVDESDFGFTGFSSLGEDVSPAMITTRSPDYGMHVGGIRKQGQRRRQRQRKGKNGNSKIKISFEFFSKELILRLLYLYIN